MARRSDLSIALIQARVVRGLSMVEAAEEIGVTRNTIANWEKGHPVPGKATLDAIARVYGIDRADLLPLWKRARRTRLRRPNGAAEAA